MPALLAFGALLKRIPWQLYVAIAIACAFGLLLHDRNHWKDVATDRQAQLVTLHRQIDARDKEARQAEAQAQKLSQQIRKQTDEENRRIIADGQSLRLSGPGKAVCISTGPGGYVQGAPKPDVAGPALPPDDRAAVPWNWLVQRSEEHDQLLAEVQAWRTWHDEVLKVWPKNTEVAPK